MSRQGAPHRVLMTADTIGGVWTYSLDLIRALDDFGVEVALATMGKPLNRDQRQAASAIRNLEVYESSYRLEWMQDPWRDIAEAGEWLLRLEADLEPGIVHLNNYCHAQLGWSAPRIVVAHSDVLSWWQAVHGEEAPSEWDSYRTHVARGLHAAGEVIAPSRAVLEDVQRSYGSLKHAKVIPNGRSPASYRCREPSQKEPFVLTVGRLWDEAKNILALDRVAPFLEWKVYAAGSAKSPDGRELRLEGLQPLGELGPDTLSDYFSRAAIYALPAKYEPFGLSVLEAALSGCALVLGDIPSLRENWEHAAIFIPPCDAEALRDALKHLIQNEFTRRDLARRARQRARFLNPRRMAWAYAQEYRALMRPQLPLSQEQFLSAQEG